MHTRLDQGHVAEGAGAEPSLARAIEAVSGPPDTLR